MNFDNLALTGWSYEKGDKQISIDELDITKRIQARNPVESTFVYSDENTWRDRLKQQSLKAANMANLDGEDIDAFFGVHNGINKHPEGASPVVMNAFQSRKHEGFMLDFSLGCASVIMGAQLAGLHFSNPSISNIILGSVQLQTQYTKNCTDGNCLFADSIGAMTFGQREDGNQIRYTQVSSNSDFADMFQLNSKGIYHMQNLHKGKDLSEFMIKSFAEQFRKGCVAMQTMPKDLDYIAMSCSTYSATKTVLDAVNFPLEKTGLECLKQVPHMGTNDLIFQIEYGIEQGLIESGSKILITGTSLGFSIGTMAIEWGIS